MTDHTIKTDTFRWEYDEVNEVHTLVADLEQGGSAELGWVLLTAEQTWFANMRDRLDTDEITSHRAGSRNFYHITYAKRKLIQEAIIRWGDMEGINAERKAREIVPFCEYLILDSDNSRRNSND